MVKHLANQSRSNVVAGGEKLMREFAGYIFRAVLPGILVLSVATAHAGTVTVYTDRTAWELAAAAVTPWLISENFEDEVPGTLSTGLNSFWNSPFGYLWIDIHGSPGLNSIEDGSINPDIASILSPDGSTFYLGQVAADTQPRLFFQPFAAPPTAVGFGADWVLGGSGLEMQVRGSIISLSDFLPTGEGFLGVITTEFISTAHPILFLSEGGDQLFGIDNLDYAGIPIPAAVWLFGSGLMGLIGLAGRNTAA